MLEAACAEAGLSTRNARLIHRYSNSVYLLPAEAAVARVATGEADRQRLACDVTRWLVRHAGAAATAPLPDVSPVDLDVATVSFWVYYPQPVTERLLTSTHLARVVRRLHDVDDVPLALDRWQPLTSLSAALREPTAAQHLTADEFQWLCDHVEDVRAQVADLDSPLGHGVIHGDAWAGNLLWNPGAGPDAVVLGDWDWVSFGPREVDLIPSWHAVLRYGREDDWADAFAQTYGYDLAAWNGFRVLLQMRDLVQLTGPLKRAGDNPAFGEALRQRLTSIRSGDNAPWRGL